MPLCRSLVRALGALVFAASCLLTAGPAFAVDPPRPLPGYRPVFVTEREPGIWEDCTWAAAAMLLDKWTNGVTTVDRERLRALSRDKEGGSNLADVSRAFDRLGFTLTTSPMGGDKITWPELLDRLGHGGGAILLGDFGKLPRHYGRWEPDFWHKTGVDDDHALYLDSYDAKNGRIFMMDPLAPAGWTGEWISVKALKRFAWHTGTALWTAMTPAAAPAPFSGVTFGEPETTADSAVLRVSWPIEASPKGWTYPAASVATTFTPVAEGDATGLIVAARPALESVPGPAGPTVEAVDGQVVASVPLPTTPGIYQVTMTVTDHRIGHPVVTTGPFSLYVPGPRAARFVLPAASGAEAGRLIPISFGISNVGTVSWDDPRIDPLAPLDVELRHNTRFVGTWVRVAVPDVVIEPVPGAVLIVPEHELAPVDLGPVRLEPGYGDRVEALVRAPSEPGTWRFVVDIVDDRDGSFALSGSAPGVIEIEVVAPSLDAEQL